MFTNMNTEIINNVINFLTFLFSCMLKLIVVISIFINGNKLKVYVLTAVHGCDNIVEYHQCKGESFILIHVFGGFGAWSLAPLPLACSEADCHGRRNMWHEITYFMKAQKHIEWKTGTTYTFQWPTSSSQV